MPRYRNITAFFFVFVCFANAGAQVATDEHSATLTIPEIALLDIEPGIAPFTLSLDIPAEAGEPAGTSAGGTNNSKWLNYSSAIAAGGTRRDISVQVTSGTVPSGLQILVLAAPATASGAGTFGTSAGPTPIGPVATNLITGIGGCYTGDGPSSGHQLTYSLSITDYGQLDFDESAVLEITFTISD